MSILFSPVGNSDPWRGARDGAMLHIVRHYRPKKVVLFFTEQIWEGDDIRPGHKAYDWLEIISNVSPNTVVEIKVDKVANAHDFDSFKDIFHHYIKEIETDHPDEDILLNVTSGTPQMEATLCLEYIVYPECKKCIQVDTPEKGSNVNLSYTDPNETKFMAESVDINERNSEPRFKEIKIISFRDAMIRSQILGLIEHYDYEGALSLIQQQNGFRNKKKLVKMFKEITENIKTHTVFPEIREKYPDKDVAKLVFHNILLKMRYERGDLAEALIRVKSIAEYIAEYYIKQKYPDIIYYDDGMPKLNKENPDFIYKYQLLLKERGKTFRYDSTLGLPSYIDIISLLEKDSKLLGPLIHVRSINGLRNSIAHRLEPLKIIGKSSSVSIAYAIDAIHSLIDIVFTDVNNDIYNYFQDKNDEIRSII